MKSPYRIGTGFDIHPLVPGRDFWVGGIKIPFDRGPLGHSDGDVLLHALADALLGAAGLDDLGSLYPDSDAANKDMASSKIIHEIMQKVQHQGFSVVNVDAVIVTEAPKLAPYRQQIRETIAKLIHLDPSLVNIKGKTAESLGVIGSGQGVAAMVSVLLEKN